MSGRDVNAAHTLSENGRTASLGLRGPEPVQSLAAGAPSATGDGRRDQERNGETLPTSSPSSGGGRQPALVAPESSQGRDSATTGGLVTESTGHAEILDVCCGGRMWWWDKNHPLAVYMDKRHAPPGSSPRRPKWSCQPDLLADFTAIPFPDGRFRLVVFDPPHLVRDTPSPASEVRLRYGELRSDDEQEVLRRGFAEAWRVLAPGGTLVFKWWGPLERVASHFPTAPTVGTRGKKATKDPTWWLIFYKPLSGVAEPWRSQLDIYDEAAA